MAVREMNEEEKAECEAITKKMHAEARDLLEDRSKKVWLFKPYYPTPRATIQTPMGPWETSEEIANDVATFFNETELEYTGAVGGQYTYSFTQTSLGVILEIKDGVSKRTINATDFNEW